MHQIITSKEFFEKYDNLVKEKGCNSIIGIIERKIGKDSILKSLEIGDNTLNKIPLEKWDKIAPFVGWTEKDPENKNRRYGILYMQVCFLKHVALYEIAKCTPIF